MNKLLVAQNETHLDLTNILFEDQIKAIDDWAQSVSIVTTNYKITWTKETFF